MTIFSKDNGHDLPPMVDVEKLPAKQGRPFRWVCRSCGMSRKVCGPRSDAFEHAWDHVSGTFSCGEV